MDKTGFLYNVSLIRKRTASIVFQDSSLKWNLHWSLERTSIHQSKPTQKLLRPSHCFCSPDPALRVKDRMQFTRAILYSLEQTQDNSLFAQSIYIIYSSLPLLKNTKCSSLERIQDCSSKLQTECSSLKLSLQFTEANKLKFKFLKTDAWLLERTTLSLERSFSFLF